MMKKTSLGTGLSSLIPNKLSKSASLSRGTEPLLLDAGVIKIPVEKIVPNPSQPRYYFDGENLKELAQSIKEHGVIQPILVTKVNENEYELIAGERRLQASKLAGLAEIPAIIRRDASEKEKLELALVENIQRHDLNPIEEAKAYKKLQSEFNETQEDVAKRTGKSRSSIANSIRLLELPVEIQRGIIEGKITEGHARAILSLENPEKQRALYDLILKNRLTVRATENKVREVSVHAHKRKVSKEADPYIRDVENRLQEKFGTKIQIRKKGASGKITIDFYSEEEFKKVIGLLEGSG